MLKHFLSVLAFMVVSFGVQGSSHFAISKGHYGAIDFMRAEPIMPLGLLTMVIQGLILSYALAAWRGTKVSVRDGLAVAGAFGLFLVSYIALVAPAKYTVPSVGSWMMVEGLAGLVQFAIFGILLGLVHKRFG